MSTTEKNRIAWPFPSFEAPSPTVVLYEVRLLQDSRPSHTSGRTPQSGLRRSRPVYFFNWAEGAAAIRDHEDDGGTLGDVCVAIIPLQYDPLRTLTEILNEYGVDDINHRTAGVCDRLPVDLPRIAVEREVFRTNRGWADPIGLSIEVADLWKEIEALREADGEKPIQMVAAEAIGRVKEERVPSVSEVDILRMEIAGVIYGKYPKKAGRGDALRAIAKAMQSGYSAEELLAATCKYRDSVEKFGTIKMRYVPLPATWFNQGVFKNYLPNPDLNE